MHGPRLFRWLIAASLMFSGVAYADCSAPEAGAIPWQQRPQGGDSHDDEGAAYAHCQSHSGVVLYADVGNRWGYYSQTCVQEGASFKELYTGTRSTMKDTCAATAPSGSTIDGMTHAYTGLCLNRAPHSAAWLTGIDPNSFLACTNGCAYIDNDNEIAYYEIDGVSYTSVTDWEATGEVCASENEPATPPPDTDGDGVSDGNDWAPNDPSEQHDSDGDGIGDNGDIAPDDPLNGEDGSQPPPPPLDPSECGGVGQPPCTRPGDESDNVATGGGTCEAPPSCAGDGIQCNQLYQQWKIRCALEGDGASVSGSPENCEAAYTCDGDTAQCAQIALLRKQACTAAITQGDQNGNGQPDWTEGAQPTPEDDGGEDETTSFGLGISTDLLDTEDIFGGGTCPPLSMTFMGVHVSSAEIPGWCTIVSIMRAAVLIMGAFTALQILLGRI